jgi:hypothetical protein
MWFGFGLDYTADYYFLPIELAFYFPVLFIESATP